MSTIKTRDGTQIYYKDWGTGQPVVFSHGWPLNSDNWEAQMVFLASNGYRCMAHDETARRIEQLFAAAETEAQVVVAEGPVRSIRQPGRSPVRVEPWACCRWGRSICSPETCRCP